MTKGPQAKANRARRELISIVVVSGRKLHGMSVPWLIHSSASSSLASASSLSLLPFPHTELSLSLFADELYIKFLLKRIEDIY